MGPLSAILKPSNLVFKFRRRRPGNSNSKERIAAKSLKKNAAAETAEWEWRFKSRLIDLVLLQLTRVH
jgi:hypothetical protein